MRSHFSPESGGISLQELRTATVERSLMPIPAAPEGGFDSGAVVLALFKQLHQQIRDELGNLDDSAVGWVPLEGANSIAVILTHLVGSEAESLRVTAGMEVTRDRDREFVPVDQTLDDLREMLARADRMIDDVAGRLTPERLTREAPLPTLPANERRPGLTWLIGNYGHAREHVGQIQLTKQLYFARSTEL